MTAGRFLVCDTPRGEWPLTRFLRSGDEIDMRPDNQDPKEFLMKCTCCEISFKDYLEKHTEEEIKDGELPAFLFPNYDLGLFYCQPCYLSHTGAQDEEYLEQYEDGYRAVPRRILPGTVIKREHLGPLPNTKWATLC